MIKRKIRVNTRKYPLGYLILFTYYSGIRTLIKPVNLLKQLYKVIVLTFSY